MPAEFERRDHFQRPVRVALSGIPGLIRFGVHLGLRSRGGSAARQALRRASDNGRKVIAADIGLADLMIFIFETFRDHALAPHQSGDPRQEFKRLLEGDHLLLDESAPGAERQEGARRERN